MATLAKKSALKRVVRSKVGCRRGCNLSEYRMKSTKILPRMERRNVTKVTRMIGFVPTLNSEWNVLAECRACLIHQMVVMRRNSVHMMVYNVGA